MASDNIDPPNVGNPHVESVMREKGGKMKEPKGAPMKAPAEPPMGAPKGKPKAPAFKTGSSEKKLGGFGLK